MGRKAIDIPEDKLREYISKDMTYEAMARLIGCNKVVVGRKVRELKAKIAQAELPEAPAPEPEKRLQSPIKYDYLSPEEIKARYGAPGEFAEKPPRVLIVNNPRPKEANPTWPDDAPPDYTDPAWSMGRKPEEKNQQAKADADKPRLSLVPPQIINDIAIIREFGTNKYHSTENWKTVEKSRYIDALYRHWLAYVADNQSVDEESGYPHLWHCACNLAFICEMEAVL